jgi:formylglycine-generating enzyme required for sulfatase activity
MGGSALKKRLLPLLVPLSTLFMLNGAGGARSRAVLYAAGRAAATEGRWPAAFLRYDTLFQLDPDYRDVRDRLAETAHNSLGDVPGEVGLETEVRLLRWLARAGEWAALAETLDRCTVPVLGGAFTMGDDAGDDDERPQRRVSVDAFEIDRYEVTNVQYQRFVRETGRRAPRYWDGHTYPAGQHDYPVVGVSWEDADAYCTWAGRRLPTEAEWEKACRGRDGRAYPWGERWDPGRANVGLGARDAWPPGIADAWALLKAMPADARDLGLRPVGSYLSGASPYGVVDLAGNVEEWVADWYSLRAYRELAAQNPLGQAPEWGRSIRGSAWVYRSGLEHWVEDWSRCAARNASHAYAHPRVGFRCVRPIL